jgi:hypothetical protein
MTNGSPGAAGGQCTPAARSSTGMPRVTDVVMLARPSTRSVNASARACAAVSAESSPRSSVARAVTAAHIADEVSAGS